MLEPNKMARTRSNMFEDLVRLNGWQQISTDTQTKWLVLHSGISVNMIQLTMQIMEQNGANSSASGSSVKSYLRSLESYNTLNILEALDPIQINSHTNRARAVAPLGLPESKLCRQWEQSCREFSAIC